jgi:hypothetical protein
MVRLTLDISERLIPLAGFLSNLALNNVGILTLSEPMKDELSLHLDCTDVRNVDYQWIPDRNPEAAP